MAETWKPCHGFESAYEVSDCGQIRRIGGRGLKPKKHSRGYALICLSVDGKAHYRSIHSLVATAFLGPCPDGCEVNHRDGIKNNNRAENLEYLTHTDNVRHAFDTGLVDYSSRQKYPDEKTCERCGSTFKPNPRKRKRQKCCSAACAQAIRVEAAVKARWGK